MTEPADNNKRLIYWTAFLSIFALITHVIDAPDHLKEWWLYGTLFVIFAAFQFFLGIALFLRPWRYDEDGNVRQNPDRAGRPFYFLGILLSVFVVALYIITHTTGMPFFGTGAAAISVTPLSLVPVVENIPLVYCFALLVRRTRRL